MADANAKYSRQTYSIHSKAINRRYDRLTIRKSNLSKKAYPDSEFVAILDWLSPLNMYQRQQDTLSRRHGSTGSWLLSTEAFQNWVHSEGSNRTLWCPGDRLYSMFSNSILLNIVPAGTGKTIMTYVRCVERLTKTK